MKPIRPASIELGAMVSRPSALTFKAWIAILRRVWSNSGSHHLGLMAAGVAFYSFLSFVPLLGALVMVYGIFADPAAVARHMGFVMAIVPTDAARLINEQLLALIAAAANQKGLALLVALRVSIFGATRASGAMIEALNVIYEEQDERGVIRGTIASVLLIVAAVLIGLLGIAAAATLAFAGVLIGSTGVLGIAVLRGLTWLAAGLVCCLALGAMYRFAPDRADARWRWLSVGAVVGTVLWLVVTLLFGLYAASFGNYNATYGSLGAVVVLLMWLYVSAYSVLIGGLINAEAERQTARDSTTGEPEPMGSRGASMADTSAALDNSSYERS